MAPRNTRSLSEMFSGIGNMHASLKAWINEIVYKFHHLPQTNFELGCDFSDQGKWNDAVLRFRIATYLQPDFARAFYNLGCCYLRLNKHLQAKQAFVRTLQLQPDYPDALLMLSALDPSSIPANKRPTRMPAAMVIEFFSGLAEDYDTIETANQYQGGTVCYGALKPLIGKREGLHVVDLGCGTGLASRPLRAQAANITGIDFAPPMVQAAQQIRVGDRPAFDAVLQEDILDLLSTPAPLEQADIVLCCNTAQFVGDLHPLVHALAARTKPEALVLLTIEPFYIAAGYGVNIDTGRFGHHPDHIKKLAATTGFTVKNDLHIHLYPSIAAQLFILTKAVA